MKHFKLIIISTMIAAGSCSPQQQKVPGIDLANLDTNVSPKENFYQYATGGWQKNNPLKPEYSRFGMFDVLGELNEERINELFKSMSSLKTAAGSVEQKISDLYMQGLDSLRLNAEKGDPLKPYIAQIEAIATKTDAIRVLADMHDRGDGGFFSAGVGADLMDSDMQIFYLGQSGLGIGNRDYYLDEENEKFRIGYREFLSKVFTLSGIDDVDKAVADAYKIEHALAEVSWTTLQERDVEAQYNPYSTADLLKAFPNVGFDVYLQARGIPYQEKLIVGEPSFFKGLDRIIDKATVAEIKHYLLARVIAGACSSLSDDYYDASWEFFSHQMSGATAQRPRWKRAMAVPNGILGEAVGKMYVDRWFPASSKEKMLALVANLQAALGEHIDSLDWMSDATKARAREKLAAFTVKIGYPDKWEDYSKLNIDPALSYYENLTAASRWAVADNLADLGKPTDRDEWGMTPQTVNAYYNPTTNEICFPAAILQPPFFNPDADDAVNYGAIGVVIGHEMSHGFDDQGRLFDAQGNMASWWTAEDSERFQQKAEALAQMFDKVEILPGLMADGHLSVGENIGDHGGLSVAWSAFQKALAQNPCAEIDGFTSQQRFYLAYAAVWAQNITEQEMARRTKLDVHSLAVNRVNVSLKNFQSFFDAFDIREGDAMYLAPEERIHIW